MISFALFLKYFPWGLNIASLACAYCLSNGKITTGRYIGVIAAIGWSTYGYLIQEYSFLFANVIFLYIYASAIIKFNSKRDEYKATFEDQKAEIEMLEKKLNDRIRKEDKILSYKKEKLKKIFSGIKKNALQNIENIEDLEKSLYTDNENSKDIVSIKQKE